MKKSVAMKWVKALRSGKYKQNTGRLRDGAQFCCLGVLCDISKVGRWKMVYAQSFYVIDDYGDDIDDMLIPKKVQRGAGLQSNSGALGEDMLSNQNDSGASFYDISCMIEDWWELL